MRGPLLEAGASGKWTVGTVLLFCVAVIMSTIDAKITVHLVPHTHDDIGWLKTVDEYQYGLNLTIQPADVNELISSVVGGLLENPDRRFTYVEIGFFSRWWNQQTNATQDLVRGLVGEKRLQFANGGWCMHDEAATHFIDMIDQTTLGHRFLKREVNAVPKVGWQVDPFGHSATQAALLSARAGFLGTYHARIDYQDYQYRAPRQEREFWWRASPSMPDAVVFGEVLLDTTYCAPDGFNWDITAVVPDILTDAKTHMINDNPKSDQYNVPEVLARFVSQATYDASITRGENIMWTMGCDFNYLAGSLWFNNLDRLIKLVNSDGRFEAKYSTPYDYTLAKLAENVTYVEMPGDFFPYADGPHQFWTGYFTSRAALKRYIRQLSSHWTAARQLEAYGGVPSGEVPIISDALGIAQHHDAVAGTAKQHVAFDYAKRLHEGYTDDMLRLQAAVNNIFDARVSVSHCPLSNESVCPSTAGLSTGSNVSVLVWNSNAHTVTSMLIEIPVPVANVAASGQHVAAYHVHAASAGVTNYAQTNAEAMPFVLAVQLANVTRAGYTTLELHAVASKPKPQVPANDDDDATVTLRTSELVVVFSTVTGRLVSISKPAQFLTVNITQDWCTINSNVGDAISSQAGGAYIFRPETNASCVSVVNSSSASTLVVVSNTPNYFVVEQQFDYITQRFIGHDDVVELEFTVNGIPIADGWGKELVARFQTSIHNTDSQGRTVVYTDSNGREMMKRVQDFRVDWPLQQTEPVAGNYYPVDALMFINDSVAQLNIFNDAGMGGGSIHEGEMYLTVHRRLLKDDSRGVSEPLNETESITSYASCSALDQFFFCGQHYGAPLIVRGRLTLSLLSTAPAEVPAMRRTREQQDEKYFAPLVLFSNTPLVSSVSSGASLLQQDLSSSLQLITAQLIDTETLLIRLAHRYAVDEDPHYAAPVIVDLTSLLSLPATVSVSSFDEYSLMATELLHENAVSTTIGPMDVKTFVAHLSVKGR